MRRARRRAGVPGDRQAELRGLDQGHRRRRARLRRSIKEPRDLRGGAQERAARVPDGVLVEEYIAGIDVDGRLHRGRRQTTACSRRSSYVRRSERRERPFNIYDYRLKNVEPGKVAVPLPGRTAARRRGAAARRSRTRSCARSACATWRGIDFRLGEDGPHLPARGQRAAVAGAGRVAVRGDRAGRADYKATIARDPRTRRRCASGLATASQLGVDAPAQGRSRSASASRTTSSARQGRRRRGRVRSARDHRRDRERARAPGPHRRAPRGRRRTCRACSRRPTST